MLKTFQDLLAAINTETDRIAAKIDALMAMVTNSSLTGAEEEQILAAAQAIHDRLAGIGVDPANPIPPVEG